MKNQSFALLKNPLCLLNTLIGFEVYLLSLTLLLYLMRELPSRIPIWQSQFFLSDRLDTPINLIFIPLLGIVFFLINSIQTEKLLQHKENLMAFSLSLFSVAIQIVLMLATIQIVLKSSAIYLQIPTYYLTSLVAFGLAYLLSFIFSPLTIKLAHKFSLMDDPQVRRNVHPAILHQKPTARAGTLPIFLAIIITGLIFIPLSHKIIAIYLGALIAVTTGILDDKFDLSPYLRLVLQIIAAIVVVAGGIGITYFTNPFGGLLWLNQIDLVLFGHHFYVLAIGFAIFWIIWVMNMINWSNGVDGQFPVIVSISAIIIGLLTLRLIPYDFKQLDILLMATITAGAVLGTAPFNWHKAKMFYGFGSTMLGLILASISILAGAKVATALLVLIVPTFDAVFTIFRRLQKGHSPVWGDRSHLHHRLHSLGWSHPQIACFYAFTTGVFGILALYSSGKLKLLTILAGAGLVAFLLIILRVRIKTLGEHSTS